MHASAYLTLAALGLLACSQQSAETANSAAGPPDRTTQQPAPAPFPETFETGSKGSYEAADEPLATGTWHLQDALIGSSPQDHAH
ncbi:hypothetical protein, partial [Hymenobacter agri]